MSDIKDIIKRLGYDKSDKLFYLPDINSCSDLSRHDRRVLKELAPYATYVVEGKVLAIFFDDLINRRDVTLQNKIWNAQVPVVISDEGNLIRVYTGKSMKKGLDNTIRLLDIVSYERAQCDEKIDFSYWNVTNSLSLNLYEKSLAKKTLNEFLIENLRYISMRLRNDYNVYFANKLILRVLFIRYLIDRGVNIGYLGLDNNVKKSQEKFLDIIKNKDNTYDLFEYLKTKFNGNLFEMDVQTEMKALDDEALILLHDFMTANIEMKSGQLCLFPFYDFNIIPIELISNIYEILLGKEKQDKDKAFYTPEYLVDYIVNRTVGKYLESEMACKVLDPSCGSGIFLVKTLQRILEKNAEIDGYIKDKNIINGLLENNIYGIDYNEEAVDVTIFSLYITIFDYQDPKCLNEFKLPLLKNKNIIFADFFDDKKIALIKEVDFNFILGNPPWGRVKQKNYLKYCDSRNITPQDGEICIAFLLKTEEIGNKNTECSLVIPSKILYKGKRPSVDFRKWLLSSVRIQQVLEISAVRKQIFKEAKAPATVISFTCKDNISEHKLEYISLKPNRFLRLFGLIMIEPDDIKYVEQKLLLNQDQLWKILVYGSYWDFELLDELRKRLPKIKDIEEEFGLIQGKGIQDHLGDESDSSHLIGRDILDSDNGVGHFTLNLAGLKKFDKEKIHRPRKKELFEPPYVLFKKGLDCDDYSIKAVYTEERILYKETINCIKGTIKNKNILLNLCGLLNSSLFAYFNLMLGSSAGIEREQVFLEELSEFPYMYSDELVELVKRIQAASENYEDISILKKQLDECVLKMFGLQDNFFVDYALNIQIPTLCGKYDDSICNAKVLQRYTDVFRENWDKNFGGSNISSEINIYPNIKGKFAAFRMNLSLGNSDNYIKFNEEVDDDIEILTKLMIYQINDCFFKAKNVAEFEEEAIVIVKSIDSKNWHPAMAIKDSHDVINAILIGEEDCECLI